MCHIDTLNATLKEVFSLSQGLRSKLGPPKFVVDSFLLGPTRLEHSNLGKNSRATQCIYAVTPFPKEHKSHLLSCIDSLGGYNIPWPIVFKVRVGN